MKHVTLTVGPERGDVKDATAGHQPVTGSASGGSTESRTLAQATGGTTLCIETQLPEDRVQLLVEMLLGLEGNGTRDVCETLIDILIRTRLMGADASRGHLFDQILSSVERLVILHAFVESGKVQARAADWLGIDRNTMHKKLRKYNLLSGATVTRNGSEAPRE